MMSLLNVLIIRDARPGHYTQSEGIVKAIRRVAETQVEYLDLYKVSAISWRLAYACYNRGIISDKHVLKWLYPGLRRLERSPDLVISAGGQTLLLNAVLAKVHDAENIFSGSLRNLGPDLFSAVLIPYKEFSGTPPYIYCLKPCAVDPDEVPPVEAPFDHCFLIGGPSGTHDYTPDDWAKMVQLAELASERFRVGVFTSRRTPQDIVTRFKQKQGETLRVYSAADIDSAGVVDFCKNARLVFVSEDSNSMITEAACCQKPVCVLKPATNTMSSKEIAYLEGLRDNKWLFNQTLSEDFSLEHLLEQMQAICPMAENHLELLAGKLRKQLKTLQK